MYTDKEILQMSSITPKIAAEYLGITDVAVKSRLISDAKNGTNLLPIGFADRTVNNKTWRYVIIPQKLVAYKNGTGREDVDRLLSGVKKSLDQVVEYLEIALRQAI